MWTIYLKFWGFDGWDIKQIWTCSFWCSPMILANVYSLMMSRQDVTCKFILGWHSSKSLHRRSTGFTIWFEPVVLDFQKKTLSNVHSLMMSSQNVTQECILGWHYLSWEGQPGSQWCAGMSWRMNWTCLKWTACTTVDLNRSLTNVY